MFASGLPLQLVQMNKHLWGWGIWPVFNACLKVNLIPPSSPQQWCQVIFPPVTINVIWSWVHCPYIFATNSNKCVTQKEKNKIILVAESTAHRCRETAGWWLRWWLSTWRKAAQGAQAKCFHLCCPLRAHIKANHCSRASLGAGLLWGRSAAWLEVPFISRVSSTLLSVCGCWPPCECIACVAGACGNWFCFFVRNICIYSNSVHAEFEFCKVFRMS